MGQRGSKGKGAGERGQCEGKSEEEGAGEKWALTTLTDLLQVTCNCSSKELARVFFINNRPSRR